MSEVVTRAWKEYERVITGGDHVDDEAEPHQCGIRRFGDCKKSLPLDELIHVVNPENVVGGGPQELDVAGETLGDGGKVVDLFSPSPKNQSSLTERWSPKVNVDHSDDKAREDGRKMVMLVDNVQGAQNGVLVQKYGGKAVGVKVNVLVVQVDGPPQGDTDNGEGYEAKMLAVDGVQERGCKVNVSGQHGAGVNGDGVILGGEASIEQVHEIVSLNVLCGEGHDGDGDGVKVVDAYPLLDDAGTRLSGKCGGGDDGGNGRDDGDGIVDGRSEE